MIHLTHSTESIPVSNRPTGFDGFGLLRRWIERIEVRDRLFAHLICRLIPHSCPFERDVTVFQHTIHIPALCKFNPVYDELVNLRLRALIYLTDVCDADITPYIR